MINLPDNALIEIVKMRLLGDFDFRLGAARVVVAVAVARRDLGLARDDLRLDLDGCFTARRP